ncbi:GL19753 [Drosophila persimilis]|uniref:GL19753 n=1 Tax=Drosophila persimilis TaxID=7234 RepID=B4IRN7_DROPE|nr:GL19753 [Drosophila persimilis]
MTVAKAKAKTNTNTNTERPSSKAKAKVCPGSVCVCVCVCVCVWGGHQSMPQLIIHSKTSGVPASADCADCDRLPAYPLPWPCTNMSDKSEGSGAPSPISDLAAPWDILGVCLSSLGPWGCHVWCSDFHIPTHRWM